MPRWLGPAVAAVAALTVPLWLTGAYELHLLITVAMLSIAALGARLLLLLGLWSFGQGVFLTIGAYVSAIFVVDLGLSFWATLPIAAIGGALAAAVIGYPALRLRGVHFAIFTMVLVFAVRQVIILTPDVTRGASGFVGVPAPEPLTIGPFELSFGSRESMYVLATLLLLVTVVVMRRIDRSRLAAVLAAIRQGETLAESVGVSVTRYQVGAFVIAAFFTTAAGAFSAQYYGVAHPEVWSLWPSIFIITYAIIGGTESVYGPIAGATLGVVIIEVLRATEGLQGILLGVTLIAVMFVMPGGIVSLVRPRVLADLGRSVRGVWQRASRVSARRVAAKSGNGADAPIVTPHGPNPGPNVSDGVAKDQEPRRGRR